MDAEADPPTTNGSSLFKTSVKFYLFVTFSYTLIYFLYITLLADDYGLLREDLMDTATNCFFTSAFVTAGSTPTELEHKSSLSRLVLASHVSLATILKVWMITV